MKILEKKEKTKVKKLVILAVWAVVITAEIGWFVRFDKSKYQIIQCTHESQGLLGNGIHSIYKDLVS